MTKQHIRLKAVGHLINRGNITFFKEIFDHISYTVVTDVMEINRSTLKRVIEEPQYYPTGFFRSLAIVMEVGEVALLNLVWNQYLLSQPAITGKGRTVMYKRYFKGRKDCPG